MKQRLIVTIAVTLTTGVAVLAVPTEAASVSCTASDVLCYQPAAEALIEKITTVTEPLIAVPAWLE